MPKNILKQNNADFVKKVWVLKKENGLRDNPGPTVVDPKQYIGRENEIEQISFPAFQYRNSRRRKMLVWQKKNGNRNSAYVEAHEYQEIKNEIKQRYFLEWRLINGQLNSIKKRKIESNISPSITNLETTSTITNVTSFSLFPSPQSSPEPVITTTAVQIKEEPVIAPPVELRQPILRFDADTVRKVVRIMRKNSDKMDNCTRLAEDLLKYFHTGRIPAEPTSTETSTADHYLAYVYWDKVSVPCPEKNRIKVEPHSSVRTRKIDQIHYCKFPRHTIFGQSLPYGRREEIFIDGNDLFKQDSDIVTVGRSLIDKEHYLAQQTNVLNLNQVLKQEAQNGGISYGSITMWHCNTHIKHPSHVITYYATPDEVYYIDPQWLDGTQPKRKQEDPICNDLREGYRFLGIDGTNRITYFVYSPMVFSAPYRPPEPEPGSTVNVKQLIENTQLNIKR